MYPIREAARLNSPIVTRSDPDAVFLSVMAAPCLLLGYSHLKVSAFSGIPGAALVVLRDSDLLVSAL
jgi:hypothetical protein